MTSVFVHGEVLDVPRFSGPNTDQEVFEAIYRRRAVRSYSDRQVNRSEVEGLLEAAIMAPSALNAQPWAFVVLQGHEELERYAREGRELLLSATPDDEIDEAGTDTLRQVASKENFELFHRAPTLILIFATSTCAVAECFLAAENLMLAAWAMGLATCPIGLARRLFDNERVKAELKIPPSWAHALAIAVGHPAEEAPSTSRRAALVVTWR